MLAGVAAQSAALPIAASKQTAFASPPPSNAETAAAQTGTTQAAARFNRYTDDYAAFCATPESERVFYALRNGSIVAEHLKNQDWKPTDWGNPPELPVPGGSHDGVPMISPIPDLAGEGPYKPAWESLLRYECPEWYRDAKFGIWNHWSPQCVPEDGDWPRVSMSAVRVVMRLVSKVGFPFDRVGSSKGAECGLDSPRRARQGGSE